MLLHYLFCRVQTNFSPLVSTLKTEIVQKFKDMKIPEKPKKPGNPYILFFKEMQDKIQSENPKMTIKQILSKCAELWKGLDPHAKQKYEEIYKQLQDKYDYELLQFQAALTNEQKHAISVYEAAKKEDRKNRRKKKASNK